jgi:hypothetical protein
MVSITPVNQKKAIPANGIRLKAREAESALAPSHSALISSTDTWVTPVIRTMLVINKIEKRIPASAAERGDRIPF